MARLFSLKFQESSSKHRPREVRTTLDSLILEPEFSTRTRPSAIASSQIVSRGQLDRHASIASTYERGCSETQLRKSRVSGRIDVIGEVAVVLEPKVLSISVIARPILQQIADCSETPITIHGARATKLAVLELNGFTVSSRRILLPLSWSETSSIPRTRCSQYINSSLFSAPGLPLPFGS